MFFFRSSDPLNQYPLTRVSYDVSDLFPETCFEAHPSNFTCETILSEISNCDQCNFNSKQLNIIRTIINNKNEISDDSLLHQHNGILIHTNKAPILRIYNDIKENDGTDLWMGINI